MTRLEQLYKEIQAIPYHPNQMDHIAEFFVVEVPKLLNVAKAAHSLLDSMAAFPEIDPADDVRVDAERLRAALAESEGEG